MGKFLLLAAIIVLAYGATRIFSPRKIEQDSISQEIVGDAPTASASSVASAPFVSNNTATATTPAPVSAGNLPAADLTSSIPSPVIPPPKLPPLPLKDEVMREPDGNYPFVAMGAASDACKARNMILPSIRQLAELAQKRGAKGILEMHQAPTREEAEAGKYRLVNALLPGGGTDQFYYSGEGYVEPLRSEIGKFNLIGMNTSAENITTVTAGQPQTHLQYWSSSEAIGHHLEADPELHSYYVFDTAGQIHDHYKTVRSLIRCVWVPAAK